jgi:GntR family transcriptional regulator of gluconate operon
VKDVKEGYPEQWLGGMSKGEGVAAEIRLLIVSGEIEVDTLLTENQVAKQFDVSRSPVRDAFKLLQTDQLIQLERMGAKVLQFGDQEKKELYDLRLMLESFAFSKIKHIDRAPITKEMRKHLEMMKVAVKFEDAEAFTQHDIQFHEAMINASNHQYLQTFWNHLKPVIETLVLLSMRHRMEQDKADFERIHSNHEVFIEAVEQYDSTKLREAFHLNFDDVGEDIESFWLR